MCVIGIIYVVNCQEKQKLFPAVCVNNITCNHGVLEQLSVNGWRKYSMWNFCVNRLQIYTAPNIVLYFLL